MLYCSKIRQISEPSENCKPSQHCDPVRTSGNDWSRGLAKGIPTAQSSATLSLRNLTQYSQARNSRAPPQSVAACSLCHVRHILTISLETVYMVFFVMLPVDKNLPRKIRKTIYFSFDESPFICFCSSVSNRHGYNLKKVIQGVKRTIPHMFQVCSFAMSDICW